MIDSKVKILLALTLILAISIWPAQASGPAEARRRSVQVEYANGAKIGIRCSRSRCRLEIEISNKRHEFSDEDLNVQIVPSDPILFSERNRPGAFSFELQVECDEYAETPPFQACYRNFIVENGIISETHGLRRTIGRDIPQ